MKKLVFLFGLTFFSLSLDGCITVHHTSSTKVYEGVRNPDDPYGYRRSIEVTVHHDLADREVEGYSVYRTQKVNGGVSVIEVTLEEKGRIVKSFGGHWGFHENDIRTFTLDMNQIHKHTQLCAHALWGPAAAAYTKSHPNKVCTEGDSFFRELRSPWYRDGLPYRLTLTYRARQFNK